MRRTLEFALSLSDQKDENSLANWLVRVLHEYWRCRGVLLALTDISGRWLNCTGITGTHPVSLTLKSDDFSHPLAGVLHSSQPRLWKNLHDGGHIDNSEFRQFLLSTGSQCGLFVLPLQPVCGQIFGVLALCDLAQPLCHLQRQEEELQLLVRLFACHRERLRCLHSSQQNKNQLQNSLRRITDEQTRQQHRQHLAENQLVGQSLVIGLLRQKVLEASGHSLSVLIEGETGTGKDIVAHLLHQCSPRASAPFVAVNCAAIPENLIESELFGFQKGAFSGAEANKAGLLAQANGGSLFLDEIGDMPVSMQVKLLRVLETRHYRPLGETSAQERYTDFRLITATHRNLQQATAKGLFREDLYHRICQYRINTPPLREHSEDIAPLCQHFAEDFFRRQAIPLAQIKPEFIQHLLSWPFPGNVRELKNLVEVACAQTPQGMAVDTHGLPAEIREYQSGNSQHSLSTPAVDHQFRHVHDLRSAIHSYENCIITARMLHFQGNRDLVAQSLNIPRRTLDYKCRKLEVQQ